MTAPPLRDIHLPAEPGLWPPAPGWWVLFALLAVAVALVLRLAWRAARRRRWRRALLADFDEALSKATSPADEVAALSSLLRRAARLRHPHALALGGEDWLRFLDGADSARPFSQGIGRLLADAPYRPVDAALPLAELRELVRARVLGLAEGRDG